MTLATDKLLVVTFKYLNVLLRPLLCLNFKHKSIPNAYQILSRVKPALGDRPGEGSSQKVVPTLEQFLENRDYTGAIVKLEFDESTGKPHESSLEWIGYCSFHLGDYRRALQIYEELSIRPKPPPSVSLCLACCLFFLGLYQRAMEVTKGCEDCPLKTRLEFQLAHKLGLETRLMELHQRLENVLEDMLCLAAVHYLRASYQEAIDIYKRILLESRQYLALNVYTALCYYKLDYFDVSQEVLASYLVKYPDSLTALNLKACNFYRLENPKAAEAEIKSLLEKSSSSLVYAQEILKHNLVVFRGGVGALQVLRPLVDIISEARLNLVIHYCRQGDYMEAYELIKNIEPSYPQEYTLKAIVNVVIGQETNSREELKTAEQLFQLVGNSVSECDTIPGRQCMASAFFLQRQFDDVLIYLSSIKSYFYNDDAFNFNYAQAKSAMGSYKEAEETLLLIQSEKIQNDYVYISHLARCYIMNGKAQLAWELYLKMETSPESLALLGSLANDCYRMGEFYQAAKAFELLERLDPSPENWEGKRGASVGLFQLIIAGRQPPSLLPEIIQLLRHSTNSQVESIIRIIKRWAKEQKINI